MMIYDAFISYRHTPLDMEFAKKVHSGLETYKVPSAVQKKTGKKKIRRVFRDQEELPIGSDLNDNIASALRESEYLIVICSPETPGSYWVAKEIETFIELHDRQHILAVLVDGEPDQSFPKLLLTDGEGNPVEPLAADVRGATPSERNKKFKTELLRLAAPILGCTYDDLRQRHRERILRRNIMIGAVVAGIIAVAGTAFGIYNAGVADRMKKLADEKAVLAEEKTVLADDKTRLADEMTVLADEKSKLADEKSKLADEKTGLLEELEAEFREKQKNQSRFYAEEAMKQLKYGNREDAVLIAAEGLPSEDNDRPFVADAEYALASALHAYDSGKSVEYDRLLEHDLNISLLNVDQNERYLTTVDYGNTVYVWDCETWKLILKLPPFIKENNYRSAVVAAFSDANGLTVAYEKSLVRYDLTGKETARIEFAKKLEECVFSETNDTVFCISADRFFVVTLSDLTQRAEIVNENPGHLNVSENGLSRNGRWFALGRYVNGTESPSVVFMDVNNGTTASATVTGEYILDMTVTDSGNVAVVSTNEYFFSGIEALTLDVFRASDGELLYSAELPNNITNLVSFKLCIGTHTHDGQSEIVIAADTDAYVFDEMSGELKNRLLLPETVATMDVPEGESVIRIGCGNGDILTVDTGTGRVETDRTVSTEGSLSEVIFLADGIVVRRPLSSSLAVMKRHRAVDLTELSELPKEMNGFAVAPSSDYYVLKGKGVLAELLFYDRDGDLLFTVSEDRTMIASGFLGNRFVMAFFDQAILVDPVNASAETIVYEELGTGKSYTRGTLSADGRILAMCGVNGVAVIDLAGKRSVYSDSSEGLSVGALTVSGDDSKLLISRTGETLEFVDLATGETRFAADASLRQVSDCYTVPYLAADAAGRYAAMACADGNVRVVSIPSGETVLTIPMQVRGVCFLAFTENSGHIIMQGDDYRVRIYGIADGVCVNSYDAPSKLVYSVTDDSRIALCDNYTVVLVDSESFGLLAYVPDAVTYLAGDRKFIVKQGRIVRSVGYKDYKELLTEAERQFPGAKLSDEKKVTYNIE